MSINNIHNIIDIILHIMHKKVPKSQNKLFPYIIYMAAMLSAILDCPDTKQKYPIRNLYQHYPYPTVYYGEKLW